jgi:hypothetical protein
MLRAYACQPVTTKTSPCGIFGEQSDTETSDFSNTSVFPCQNHFTTHSPIIDAISMQLIASSFKTQQYRQCSNNVVTMRHVRATSVAVQKQ